MDVGRSGANNDVSDTGKRTRNRCCVICSGIVLLILVVVPIIVITTLKEDNTGTTEYYKVSMNLSVDQQFLPAHNDTQSTEYKDFTRDFCAEIDKVYENTTDGLGSNYHGCIVTELQNGSIKVEFNLYTTGLNVAEAKMSNSKLISSLANNRQRLGSFNVIGGSLQLVSVSKLPALPDIPNILPETTHIMDQTTENSETSSTTTMDPPTVTNATTSTTTAISSTTTTMDPPTVTDATTSTTTAIYSTTTTMDPTRVTDETTSTTTTDETTSTTATMDTTTIVVDVDCQDSTFIIGNRAIYTCSLTVTEFDEIIIVKLSDTSLTLVTISMNGTITYVTQVDPNITYAAGEKVELTFSNISCFDEGTYEITVRGNFEDRTSKGNITVQRQPSAPRLTMHEDQVIDLQFYRLNSENECEAEVGNPPGYLVIEVQNGNSTDYDEIPSIDITYVENTTTSEDCSNTQLLRFGMNYTSDMDNGKIRCRVESNVGDEMMSVEKDLLLIPRNICSCVDGGSKRGHPKRCDVQVHCIEDKGIMYPLGVLCGTNQCRNSLDGTCSSDCSSEVCNQPVPSDSPEKPILKLNADQVIDLEFDDGVFYRRDRFHTCKGDVGNSSEKLIIEMMYDNQTMFQMVPEADIAFLQPMSTRNYCQKFGLRFSYQMNGGKVRCRVSGNYDNKTTSDEETMQLIPRNICSCGDGDSKRGHPKRCDVQVHCIEEKGIMYPLGALCGTNQCRNSINGTCSDDCSPEVCNQPVPSDFCTTPAPPTTTLAPSMYISCKDIGAFQYSGPVHIVCNIQNNLDFVGINISKDGDNIAQIDNNHAINPSVINDNVVFSINDTNIIITIDNVTCNDGGVYTVVIIMTNTTASAEARLFINRLPEKPQLIMNPDTIIDLGFYRGGSEHSCEGDVGYPPGTLVVEGKIREATMYHEIANISYTRNTTESGACSSMQYLSFGISFYPELDHGKIRCRVQNYHYSESNGAFSTELDLVLIPRNICLCAMHGNLRGHPGRCDAYVVCVNHSGIMYPFGRLCIEADRCRNSITGVCTTDCSNITCTEEVPSDFCTTVATSTTATP